MQTFITVLFFIVGFTVAAELLVHMLYHWKTGKAGLYDPPFKYLKDIYKKAERRRALIRKDPNTFYYTKSYPVSLRPWKSAEAQTNDEFEEWLKNVFKEGA